MRRVRSKAASGWTATIFRTPPRQHYSVQSTTNNDTQTETTPPKVHTDGYHTHATPAAYRAFERTQKQLTLALVMPLYTMVRVLSEQKYMSLRQFRSRSTSSLAAMRLNRYISRSRASPAVVSLLTMNCSTERGQQGQTGCFQKRSAGSVSRDQPTKKKRRRRKKKKKNNNNKKAATTTTTTTPLCRAANHTFLPCELNRFPCPAKRDPPPKAGLTKHTQ